MLRLLHTRAFFFLFFLILPPLIACDTVSSLGIGKPSTSAPRSTSDAVAFWEACRKKEDKIDHWQERELKKLEDSWAKGNQGLFEAGMRYGAVEQEADAMRRELNDNCHAADISMNPLQGFPGDPEVTERGSCVKEQGGDGVLESVRDVDGSVFPTYRLSYAVTDGGGGASRSSCGIPIEARWKKNPDGMWAGHVYGRDGAWIRVSKATQDGEYVYLEGWVRP